jgi:hypothetical protein
MQMVNYSCSDLTIFLPRGAATDMVLNKSAISPTRPSPPARKFNERRALCVSPMTSEPFWRHSVLATGIGLTTFFVLVLGNLPARNRSNAEQDIIREGPVVTVCCPAQKLGTTIDFCSTPVDAAALAAEQHKLVFLLHISGNFEDCGFT